MIVIGPRPWRTRCRRDSRAPARAGAGRPRRPAPRLRRPLTERPSSSARASKRPRTFSTTSTRSVGSRPQRGASPVRRERGSAGRPRSATGGPSPRPRERIEFSSSWSCASGAARARARRELASGVRSSWLASATKRRSRSSPSSIRASISFSVRPSRDTSSSAAGTGRRSSERRGRDLRGPAAHRLDRAQRAPASRYPPSEARSNATGPPTRNAACRLVERLVAVLERARTTSSPSRERDREHPADSSWLGTECGRRTSALPRLRRAAKRSGAPATGAPVSRR